MSSSGAGDAGSTVWPSDASSAAASSAAAVHAGSTGTSPAGAVALSTPTAQRAGCGADLVEERPARRRGRVRVAGHRARERVEHRRAVAHRAGDHVADHESGPRLAVVGPERDAPARGLQPEQAARAGGDADRTTAVAGVRDRHHARRHRGRAAAARSTGRTREVPRVVRGAVSLRLGGRRAARAPGCSSCRR